MEQLNRGWSVPLPERNVDARNAATRQRNFPTAPSSEIDVSVVVVSWNTRDILRGCLRSIFEQTREVSFEVFVVDNKSHDGSAEMVRDYALGLLQQMLGPDAQFRPGQWEAVETAAVRRGRLLVVQRTGANAQPSGAPDR